jgi:hypothetical protein
VLGVRHAACEATPLDVARGRSRRRRRRRRVVGGCGCCVGGGRAGGEQCGGGEGGGRGREQRLLDEARRADVLFHQLRSRALKVLCVYLADATSAQFIVSQRGFVPILKLSILQTSLQEWASMEQLEVREARLLELLFDLQNGVPYEPAQLQRRAALAAHALPHSPYGKLAVALPTHMDTRDAINVQVRRGTRITARLPMSGDGVEQVQLPPELQSLATVALCRANHVIPSSVPAFYFEVTIERAGTPLAATSGGGGGVRTSPSACTATASRCRAPPATTATRTAARWRQCCTRRTAS